MASFVRMRPEAAQALLRFAEQHANANGLVASEMGLALVVAGLSLLSGGMDDEQVRALFEQAFELTAPIRRATEERWRRTGFDRGKSS